MEHKNFFARNIGVFYNDKTWARIAYSEIINHIPADAISEDVRMEHVSSIILKDGTFIEILPKNYRVRKRRFHEIYLQEGIDFDTYENLIKPTLLKKIDGSSSIFVVEIPEVEFSVRRLAKNYYESLEK